MDKICIKGLKIFAYHGVNEEEKVNGQDFILDLKLEADLSHAKLSDDINDTVSYSAVRKTVNRVFTSQKFDLIERAAKVVCDEILLEYPQVMSVTLELKKPDAPMNAKFDYVSIKIKEKRD